jgi:hypothetical protein
MLKTHFTIARPEIVEEQVSNDGTRKWLLRFPAARRGSSGRDRDRLHPRGRPRHALHLQPGRLHAHLLLLPHRHAEAGAQPDGRGNPLPADDARDRLGDFPDRETPVGAIVPSRDRKITNIVMMGMGEPLYNFEAVKKALLIASDGDGLSLSKRASRSRPRASCRRSSRTGEEIGVMLAISLHAVRDELRDMLVPINKKYPLKELIEACRNYPGLSNARRITFEYVMLKDVNDSLEDAKELVQLLKGIPAKINLIPFNPWPGTNYQCSDWARSRSSPTSSTRPAMPRRSARRAAATSSPPAASSSRNPSACARPSVWRFEAMMIAPFISLGLRHEDLHRKNGEDASKGVINTAQNLAVRLEPIRHEVRPINDADPDRQGEHNGPETEEDKLARHVGIGRSDELRQEGHEEDDDLWIEQVHPEPVQKCAFLGDDCITFRSDDEAGSMPHCLESKPQQVGGTPGLEQQESRWRGHDER